MLRIIGILLLSLAPMLYGIHKGSQLRIQKDNLEGFMYLVRECQQGIEFQQRPIADIISGLSASRYPVLVGLSQNIKNTDPLSAWKKMLLQKNLPAVDVMDDFWRALGTSDSISQMKICNVTLNRLSEIRERMESETESKVKLYRSVGMLAGVFVAIMLI